MTSIAQVALPSPTKIGIVFFFFPNKIESINLERQFLFFTIADVACCDWLYNRMMLVVDSCESRVTPISTYHFNKL